MPYEEFFRQLACFRGQFVVWPDGKIRTKERHVVHLTDARPLCPIEMVKRHGTARADNWPVDIAWAADMPNSRDLNIQALRRKMVEVLAL